MDGVVVGDPAGLKKIVGLHIDNAQLFIEQGNPKLVMELSHIALGQKVILEVKPGIELRIPGVSITASPALHVTTKVVEPEVKKED